MKKLLAMLFAGVLVCGIGVGCGDNDGANQEDDRASILTKDTDFEALVSDEVTEEVWDAAFTNASFAGCSVLIKSESNDCTAPATFAYRATLSGYEFSVTCDFTQNGEVYQSIKRAATVEGNSATLYQEVPDEESGELHYMYQVYDISDEKNASISKYFLSFRSIISYDLAGQFGSFTYDETLNAYVCESCEVPFDTMTWSEQTTGHTLHNVTVKMIGRKVAYVKVDEPGECQEYCYFDYGKTQVVIPRDAQLDPED